ncbi:MAG TPA: hypothetical protein VEI97_06645, partial [bacterium]|nr:hypothetical protein [bacterium]
MQVHKAGEAPVREKLADVAGKVMDRAGELTDKVLSSAHVERSRVADYVGILTEAHEQFVAACGQVAAHHFEEAEIVTGMRKLSEFSAEALESLRPFADRYGERGEGEAKELRSALFPLL